MSQADPPKRRTLRWILLGVLMGGAALAAVLLLRDPPFEEVEEFFADAEPQVVAAWQEELDRRIEPWREVPDPPGEGRVVRGRFWLSRYSYDMDVRRRGDRFVVSMCDVAPHIHGGGWAAYGEGRISGPPDGFRGAVATFTWSCLGVRFRHASDGVGRLVWDEDGDEVVAVYMAYESPAYWAKAYGRRQLPGEARPPMTSLRGQIPIAPLLQALPVAGSYRLRVRVANAAGEPLQGALVQVKGHDETRVLTDEEGRCELGFRGAQARWAQVISVGCEGHRNGEAVFLTGDSWPGLVEGGVARAEVPVVLAPLDAVDHADYAWARASKDHDPDDLMACGTCHPWQYDEWYESRHARMASHGHVDWERERMLAQEPEAPDDCHGCHQPAHAVAEPASAWSARGALAGNHCDFCHKIRAVRKIEASGVLGAYELLRPDPQDGKRPGGLGHVFGPSPDVGYAYMGASYSPLFEASHLCGGCHQGGGRWETGSPPKIDTYEEWNAWVVQQPTDEAKTCQQCHMPAATTRSDDGRLMDQLAWDALHRTPEHLHSHRFPGVQPPFAAEALEVRIDKRRDFDRGEWIVKVSVTNAGAGHKVPTGTWSKRVVVGVWASLDGVPLRQVGGDRTWLQPDAPTGVAYEPGDWRNPGGFVLGVFAVTDPDGKQTAPPFWMRWPKAEILDRRLAPGETRTATCRFKTRDLDGVPEVEVRILHRRARLAAGAASVPWTVAPNDPAPEVLWSRIRR